MARVLAEGYLLGVLVSLPIGPVTIALMRRALMLGFWNATCFGGGSASADLVYIGLVYFGVAPLLTEVTWLRVTLWALGALWLGWLGVDAIRSARQAVSTTAQVEGGKVRSYVAGVGITLLNPLTIVSWITLGGGYFALHPETRTLGGGLLALLAILVGLMSHVVVVSAVLASGRRWLSPTLLRALSALAGVILLLIAVSFLLSAAQGVLESVSV